MLNIEAQHSKGKKLWLIYTASCDTSLPCLNIALVDNFLYLVPLTLFDIVPCLIPNLFYTSSYIFSYPTFFQTLYCLIPYLFWYYSFLCPAFESNLEILIVYSEVVETMFTMHRAKFILDIKLLNNFPKLSSIAIIHVAYYSSIKLRTYSKHY